MCTGRQRVSHLTPLLTGPFTTTCTVKARRLLPDGTYELIAPEANRPLLNSQAWLIAHRPNHLRSEEI